jgi:hypothetical protein
VEEVMTHIEHFQHPMREDAFIRNNVLVLGDDDIGIAIYGYSTYGRFLFTELNLVCITNNVIIGDGDNTTGIYFKE